jgi:hypothetical protein
MVIQRRNIHFQKDLLENRYRVTELLQFRLVTNSARLLAAKQLPMTVSDMLNGTRNLQKSLARCRRHWKTCSSFRCRPQGATSYLCSTDALAKDNALGKNNEDPGTTDSQKQPERSFVKQIGSAFGGLPKQIASVFGGLVK